MNLNKKATSILYVEDEKNIQDELAVVLRNFCDTLYLADDGVQGLKEYAKHIPDIIITDIKMPFMDGIEMSKRIKEMNKESYIIFLTAFSDIEFFQEAIELQVDGYIFKPIDLDLLTKKINEIKKHIELKEDLYHSNQMLIQQSKLASMGEMLGNIAHQWRQPLSGITTNTSLLQLNMELGKKITDDEISICLANVMKQAEYLSRTIDEFRSFYNTQKQSINFNIKEFIQRCMILVQASFDENTIKIIKNIDEKVNILGDPNQLAQALLNILNNAKDALKNAENIQEKLVFIFTIKKLDNDFIEIIIKDNAGGIPENIIDRIFEPYFTTKGPEKGTGLGLHITNTVITKNLNGSIRVVNDEFTHEGILYKGAKFTITLPSFEVSV